MMYEAPGGNRISSRTARTTTTTSRAISEIHCDDAQRVASVSRLLSDGADVTARSRHGSQ